MKKFIIIILCFLLLHGCTATNNAISTHTQVENNKDDEIYIISNEEICETIETLMDTVQLCPNEVVGSVEFLQMICSYASEYNDNFLNNAKIYKGNPYDLLNSVIEFDENNNYYEQNILQFIGLYEITEKSMLIFNCPSGELKTTDYITGVFPGYFYEHMDFDKLQIQLSNGYLCLIIPKIQDLDMFEAYTYEPETLPIPQKLKISIPSFTAFLTRTADKLLPCFENYRFEEFDFELKSTLELNQFGINSNEYTTEVIYNYLVSEPIEFIIDKPFYYVVTSNEDMVLYWGRYDCPIS